MVNMGQKRVIQITPKNLGAKKMSRKTVIEYFSENTRQSFRAEGVRYSKKYWDSVRKKYQASRAKKSTLMKKK